MTFYSLEIAGALGHSRSFDVFTSGGAYAGIISWKGEKGYAKVYYNSTATKGSARKFPSVGAALDFMHERRERRGMNRRAA